MSVEDPRFAALATQLAAAHAENTALVNEVFAETRRAEAHRLETIGLLRQLEQALAALATDTIAAQRYAAVRAQVAFYSSANRHLHGAELDAYVDTVLSQSIKRFRIGEQTVLNSPHAHQCAWCGIEIAALEAHCHWRSPSDTHGELMVVRMHPECAQAEGSRHALLRERGWRMCLETRGVAGRRIPESL